MIHRAKTMEATLQALDDSSATRLLAMIAQLRLRAGGVETEMSEDVRQVLSA